MTTDTLLNELHVHIVYEARQLGLDWAQSVALASRVESSIRINRGGRSHYIHALDLDNRNQLIIEAAARGEIRDKTCTRYGVSRRAYYRILSGN